MPKTTLTKYVVSFLFVSTCLFATAKAGNFGEHKLIGDSAFKKYCETHPAFAAYLKEFLESEPIDFSSPLIPLSNTNEDLFYRRSRYFGQYPILILDGKAVTYGDFTALSGDHSPDYIEIYRQFDTSTFGATGLFNKLFADMLHQYCKQLKNINSGGTGYNPVFLEFICLAAQDKSHFHIPAMPLRQEIDIVGHNIYNHATELLHSELIGKAFAAQNLKKALAFFEANSVAKYSILHTIAKMYYMRFLEARKNMEANLRVAARQPANSSDANTFQQLAALAKERAKKFLLLTLFTNAFSEHYLQDMFASGHFFADRNAPDFLGLEAKGIHDFFGRRGVVALVNGKADTLYGDGNYSPRQLDMAVQANLASLLDVFDVDINNHRKAENDYLELLRTPSQEVVQIFPALKLIPEVPLGKNYSEQRKNIGRSISGGNYGLYALGSDKSYGAGITTGFNFIAIPSVKSSSPIESRFGFGFNAFFDATVDTRNTMGRKLHGQLGIGANLFFFDWLYAKASIVSSLPVRVSGKFEQGIQIKPLSWKYGINIGIVEYSSNMLQSPLFTIGIIHY